MGGVRIPGSAQHFMRGWEGMTKLRFPNGYTGEYKDAIAAVLIKKGQAVRVEEEAAAERQPPKVPLERMKLEELRALAREKGLEGFEDLTRAELIELLKE